MLTGTPAKLQHESEARPADHRTPVAPASILDVHDITVAYHRKPVLWNVSLDVPSGSLVGLVGPNGAGKSTLLKAVVGMVQRISISVYCS